MRFRDRFQNFMSGRYGNDQLNQFLSIAALVCIVVNIFIRRQTQILWIIAVVLLIWVYFRTFSRNTSQRAIENDRWLAITSRFRRGGRRNYDNGGYGAGGRGYANSGSASSRQESAERKRAQRQDKRYYKYYNCPNCNQKVRVPKGKGKIEITCPKCRTSFIRKT